MKKAVRAIVINGDKLLVMKRNKFGQEYYILVGGGVDIGETEEQSLFREIKEETGIQVSNPILVYIEKTDEMYGTQYVYLCDYVSGEPNLAPDSIEAEISQKGENTYESMWVSLKDFETLNFRSENLKQHLLTGLKDGWPSQPVEFSTEIK